MPCTNFLASLSCRNASKVEIHGVKKPYPRATSALPKMPSPSQRPNSTGSAKSTANFRPALTRSVLDCECRLQSSNDQSNSMYDHLLIPRRCNWRQKEFWKEIKVQEDQIHYSQEVSNGKKQRILLEWNGVDNKSKNTRTSCWPPYLTSE